jgi:hypothetical protein
MLGKARRSTLEKPLPALALLVIARASVACQQHKGAVLVGWLGVAVRAHENATGRGGGRWFGRSVVDARPFSLR